MIRDTLMREGTVELLEKADDIVVVGQAGTGDEALRLLEHCRADVMLVDVNLPGMSGLELVLGATSTEHVDCR